MKRMLPVCFALLFVVTLSACGTSSNSAADDTEQSAGVEDASPIYSAEPDSSANDDTRSLASIETNPVLQLIDQRNSTPREEFTGKEIDEDLLQLLGWAATGKNRDGTGFVVPRAMGAEPYVSLNLVQESGVRRCLWEDNSFETILTEDIRSQVAMIDIEGAYAYWVYVIDLDLVPMGNTDWGYHTIGAMSEHQYLVAEEFDVQARYMAAVDAEAVIALLGFNAEEKLPAGVMVMAHK